MGKKLTRDLNGDSLMDTYGVDRPWGYWRTAVAQAGGGFQLLEGWNGHRHCRRHIIGTYLKDTAFD